MTVRVSARDAEVELQAVRGGEAPGIRNPNGAGCETLVAGHPPARPWRRALAALALAPLLSAATGARARRTGRLRLLGATLFVALAAALPPATAGAQTQTLVSNTGQTPSNDLLVDGSVAQAQGFTTGTNASGYVLSEVQLWVASGAGTPTVSIWSDDGSGNPGALLHTLVNPANVMNFALNAFAAPTDAVLLKETQYLVVADTTSVDLAIGSSNSNAEDSGAAAGWSIANSRRWSDDGGSSWNSATNNKLRIAVRGSNAPASNAPQVATAIPDQTATVGVEFSYEVPAATFTDADSFDTLTWSATLDDGSALPTWLSFDPDTRTFTGTPTAAGTITVKVKVDDGRGGMAEDSFDIVLRHAALVSNTGQEAGTGINVAVDERVALEFTTGSNLSGYSLAGVEVHVASGHGGGDAVSVGIWSADSSGHPDELLHALMNPASVTNGADNTFTAPADAVLLKDSRYLVVVGSTSGDGVRFGTTASFRQDAGGAAGWSIADTQDIQLSPGASWLRLAGGVLRIAVQGSNAPASNPPQVATAIPDQTATVGVRFSYEVPAGTFTDADSFDTLNWSATLGDDSTLPVWLAFDPDTRTFTGTPTAAGTITVKVKVDDGRGGMAEDSFDIAVGAAGGAPSISGTATVGQLLTAGAGNIADADGLPAGAFPAGYTFQWIRVASDNTETDIDGETSQTYTLAAADVGSTVKVRVSFTDGAGNAEMRTSGAFPATGSITDPRGVTVVPTSLDVDEGGATGSYTVVLDSEPSGDVTVTPASDDTGAATVSGPLTFTTSNWDDPQAVTVTAIEDEDADNEIVTITNAVSGANYGSVPADDVTVTVDDDEIPLVSLVSNTGQSHDLAELVGFNFIRGDTFRRGQEFTIGGTGTYLLDSVQLELRGYGGSDDVQVSIYTEENGSPGTSLYTFSKPATITNNALNSFTAPENAVIAANTRYFVVVEAPSGDFNVSFTNSNSEDSGGVSGSNIGDNSRRNTGGSWLTTTQAIRIAVRGSQVTGTNNPPIGGPAIAGTPTAGEVLTANRGTIADVDGLPASTFPADYSFQWVSVDSSDNETEITGATSRTFTLRDADIGGRVRVKVSFTDGAGNDETVISDVFPATGTIANPRGVTVTPTSLDVNEGGTGSYTVVLATQPTGDVTVTPASDDTTALTVPGPLTFTASNWSEPQTVTVNAISDSDSVNETVTISHSVAGADYGTYGSGRSGSVTVRVYDGGSTTAALVSNTGRGPALIAIGSSIGASGSGRSESAFAQEFMIGGSAGAYRLHSVRLGVGVYDPDRNVYINPFESGDGIRVSIWTRGADGNPDTLLYTLDNPVSITDAALNTFTAPANAAIARNTPYLVVVEATAGEFKMQVISSRGEDPGSPSGSVIGDSRRNLQQSDNTWSGYGQPLRIAVRGAPRSASNTPATGSPSISGTPSLGGTLTAGAGSIHDIDGLPAGAFPAGYTFQWIRVASDNTETDIARETSQTYTLAAADVGSTVKVRVSFTDGAGNAEMRTSGAFPATGSVTNPRGVTVDPTSLDVDEGGATGSYTVVLDSEPSGDVTVTPASGDTSSVTVSGPLTFTTSNWDDPQAVTVTAIEDEDADNEIVTITNAVSGANYGSVPADDVTVTVDDDEIPVVSLVSNTGQTPGLGSTPTPYEAQAFTTGSNVSGYLLSEVRLHVSSYGGSDQVSVGIHIDASGNPGALLYALENPATVTSGALNAFAAPADAILLRETQYHVVVEAASGIFVIGNTISSSEDAGGAVGWTIANYHTARIHGSSSWTRHSVNKLRIAVRGSNAPASNAPEVATQIPDQTATVGVEFSYEVPAGTFTDADSFDTLTWSATLGDDSTLPVWLTFDPDTRTFTGTPPSAGTITVKVKVDDGRGGMADDSFDIAVRQPVLVSNTGQTPGGGVLATDLMHAQGFTTGTNESGYLLDAVEFHVSSYDGSEQFGVGIWSADSSGNPGALLHTLESPATVTNGTFNIFTAPADAVLLQETQYLVVVEPVSGTVNWGSTVSNAEDAGGAAGWSIANSRRFSGNGGSSWSSSGSTGGKLRIAVRGSNAPASNPPQVATAIPDQEATVGVRFSYEVPAATFTDADSFDTLTWSATLDDGSALPTWLSFDPDTRTFSGTPPSAGTITVKVNVDDGRGGMAEDSFDIVVRQPALVSNTGQTPDTGIVLSSGVLANTNLVQPFTTGSNLSGYLLDSVQLHVSAYGRFGPDPGQHLHRCERQPGRAAACAGEPGHSDERRPQRVHRPGGCGSPQGYAVSRRGRPRIGQLQDRRTRPPMPRMRAGLSAGRSPTTVATARTAARLGMTAEASTTSCASRCAARTRQRATRRRWQRRSPTRRRRSAFSSATRSRRAPSPMPTASTRSPGRRRWMTAARCRPG